MAGAALGPGAWSRFWIVAITLHPPPLGKGLARLLLVRFICAVRWRFDKMEAARCQGMIMARGISMLSGFLGFETHR